MNLEGKVAVVTGGAIRIGRAISLALAEAGCHLFIHYGRSVEAAHQLSAIAESFGVKAHLHAANLADFEAVQEIIPAAVSQYGNVDILINNAAIFPDEDSLETMDIELWEKLFAINLRAPFFLCQAFAAQLPQEKNGRIININDARIKHPDADHLVYRLTKSGLWYMTDTLVRSLAPRITINAVALGSILPPPNKDLTYLDRIIQSRVPLQRHISAETVAENVLYMLQQDSLTGVTIPIDGGEYM